MMRFPLRLILSLLALGLFPLAGKNLPDAGTGCRMNVPDNWDITTGKPPNGANFFAATADRAQSINLFITPVQETALDENSEYVKGFEDFCETHGVSIASRKHEMLNGRDFFVIRVARLANAVTTVNSTIWMIIANGQIYQISLTANNADPDKNADLTAAIQSFDLLKKPAADNGSTNAP